MGTYIKDSICALATASGRSGIGIIRISGDKAKLVALKILKTIPEKRQAKLLKFYDNNDEIIDTGIAIFFEGPNSFTGEDVLELQAHGGPVLLDLIIKQVLNLDVRSARAGEFTERAFLNKKIDLTQAEAIADIIDAASEKALRCASKSLQGEFSKQINIMVESLISLRIFIESAIDFPEEEIDFINKYGVSERLLTIKEKLQNTIKSATAGQILREGITVVIAGQPNVGKSSLLNRLAGKASAIVTDIPGTTRDVLKEYIHIDGIPLHILDTAGLRETDNVVEQAGIKRAWNEIKQADCILFLIDDSLGFDDKDELILADLKKVNTNLPIITVYNKIDISKKSAGIITNNSLAVSAQNGDGFDSLTKTLKEISGFTDSGEGIFIARRRHLEALNLALTYIFNAESIINNNYASELLAEDLRSAQNSLSEITGVFTSDDLLGRIFTDFCIGK